METPKVETETKPETKTCNRCGEKMPITQVDICRNCEEEFDQEMAHD